MISALLFFQFTSARNALVQRLKRLKQPKYLIGAIAGVSYFYFLFFRKLLHLPDGAGSPSATLPAGAEAFLEPIAALAVLAIATIAWFFPAGRTALRFTESEVAFLFPAPIPRRALIHFKLLKSQFAILLSSLFFAVISNRSAWLGGNAVTHALGWWIIFSTFNLYFIGVSFARERWFGGGESWAKKFAWPLAATSVVALLIWIWLRETLPPFPAQNTAAIEQYFQQVARAGPLPWLLAVPKWIVRPFLAADWRAFALTLGPALGVMVLHYWWIMRTAVAFEEAAVEQARQQAEVSAAVRAGGWRAVGNRPTKPRPAPFVLAATGLVAVAFLWKSLIALGPWFRLRTWLAIAGGILAFHGWARFSGLEPRLYLAVGVVPLVFGAWLLIAGPMMMRRDVRLMVTHFDLLKGYPLRGWQVVLGALLSPIVVLVAIEWLLLFLGAPSLAASQKAPALAALLAAGGLGIGTLGIALVVPPLTGLMLSIPFAATLYFPAWTDNSAVRGGGIEVMGQRLIFFAGYLVVLLMALLPALLCGGLAAFIVHWLAGTVMAIIATAVVASVIISAEFAAIVWWLGERFEKFDLSAEMPR